MHDALYHQDGDAYVATPLCRGPWDDRHQHGGPPAALLAGALARFGDPSAFQLARITIELLRPVPIGRVVVTVTPERQGRQVERLGATLTADDQLILRASAIRIRRMAVDAPPPVADPPWPAPDGLPPFTFSFFRNEVAYHRAVDLRLAYGAWGRTPVGFWARPAVPLVAGRAWLPEERLLVLADAESGMGPPLDPMRWTYLNPDLTVYFERQPRGEWLGFDIRSVAGPDGMGLSQSAVRDRDGVCARSAQSLIIAPR